MLNKIGFLAAILSLLIVVLIINACIGFSRRTYLDLESGERRDSTFIYSVEVHRNVESTRVSEALGNRAGRHRLWLLLSVSTLKQPISPNLQNGNTLAEVNTIIQKLEIENATRESIRVAVDSYLRNKRAEVSK